MVIYISAIIEVQTGVLTRHIINSQEKYSIYISTIAGQKQFSYDSLQRNLTIISNFNFKFIIILHINTYIDERIFIATTSVHMFLECELKL